MTAGMKQTLKLQGRKAGVAKFSSLYMIPQAPSGSVDLVNTHDLVVTAYQTPKASSC